MMLAGQDGKRPIISILVWICDPILILSEINAIKFGIDDQFGPTKRLITLWQLNATNSFWWNEVETLDGGQSEPGPSATTRALMINKRLDDLVVQLTDDQNSNSIKQ